MTISLLDVNDSNWRECADLQLAAEEKLFLSSNVYALAEWKFETESIFRAIYADTVLVGMLAYYLHDGEYGYFYWLYHLMIEKKYQGKGYGEAAVKLAVKEMLQLGATEIRTMHMPGNTRAQNLYKKLGFEQIGTLDGGDIFLRLTSI
jgi:diamine N-acetyltransferase